MGYIALANAVIEKAILDARMTRHKNLCAEARRWLITDGYEWLSLLGRDIDVTEWNDWVLGGCRQKLNFQTKL